jgi:hypothetical protein
MKTIRELDDLFAALAKSSFRQQFRLGPQEHRYLDDKGVPAIIAHARDFIQERLVPAEPENDGRQTPMRGHPIFIAQHATATCCRSCLAKWHGVAKGTFLSDEEVDYVICVLTHWIERQGTVGAKSAKPASRQRDLFD